MLSIPFFFDQLDSAVLIEEAGVGTTLSPETLAVEGAESAMRRLLNNPTFRESAARIGAELRHRFDLSPTDTGDKEWHALFGPQG